MARLSDIIEAFLKQMLEEAEGALEIQRNELASYFNCAPSQINYVIDTRFNTNRGYYVESRRGGGGYISIRKINVTKDNYLMHVLASMGDRLNQQTAEAFINNLVDYNVVDEREGAMLKAAVSDKLLSVVPIDIRDSLRANIFKNMLASLLL